MNNKNKSNHLRSIRSDLSPYLFHYTKGSNPYANMESILQECCLKSQKHNYICFTDAPATSNIPLLEYMYAKYPQRPMYSHYGIGFSRDIMYEKYDARNVIYGTLKEKELIDISLHWRFEEMNIETHDFSWLREWRIEGNNFDFSEFPKEHIIIIAPTKVDLNSLIGEEDYEVDFSYEHEIRSSIPYLIQTNKRKLKGFTTEEIKNTPNDFTVSAKTENQIFGEDIGFL
ncbi:hypothetical protein [Parabacteroides sp. PF5-9]|uniref:hypothetical protein n=1 Tax=Parabacteroides sp. PF5-9 TaxID=1742404 RepID=UPI002477055A|nr:hypothetical protein [Parabacteroides sp. PF5-9]MDH6357772.1 hypothetical protein [Parabacteroides sp. PF5-9]